MNNSRNVDDGSKSSNLLFHFFGINRMQWDWRRGLVS